MQTGTIGEAGSLSAALEENRERLLRFLVARTRDPALAEDLMQEARLKLHSAKSQPAVENPVPYLFRMLENLVEDHRRSETSRTKRNRQWGDRGQGLEPQRAEHVTPEQWALDRDMLDKTLAALDTLPERTRAVFLAYRVEGNSQKDIAAAHSISLSAVEKHLQRAYRAVLEIRQQLDAGGDA